MPKPVAPLIETSESDDMDDESMMDEGDDLKAEAGSALASAIKSGDGSAICEAVKAIMALEDYDDDAEV